MTDEQMAQIRARAEAATPGKWIQVGIYDDEIETEDGEGGWLAEFSATEDAAFCAHARQDVPALLAEIERLRAEVDGQQATIERLLVRNGELREVVRAVASANRRLTACGQAAIDWLDIPQPGKLQERARALLVTGAAEGEGSAEG